MKVRVRYFAVVREKTGLDEETWEFGVGTTVAQFREAMAAKYPVLAALLPRIVVSVNREYAKKDHVLADGDEAALIPPIAGGSGEKEKCNHEGTEERKNITENQIDVAAVEREVVAAGMGAVVTFTGCVRDENEGRSVSRLDYEAYPEMAEAKLAEVVATVLARWPGVRVALRHRVGTLAVGDVAVVIAVAAPHRREAFEACAFAIDFLKETVPIWKRETGPDGTNWVGCKP